MTLTHFDIRSTNEVDTRIEEGILALEDRIQIDEARVRLERRHRASPPFRVAVHLVTPGPDLIAEGQDHTILAAIRKMLVDVETKLNQRAEKRSHRGRGRLKSSPVSRTLRKMR